VIVSSHTIMTPYCVQISRTRCRYLTKLLQIFKVRRMRNEPWGRGEAAAAVLQRLHKHSSDALRALEQNHFFDAVGAPHAELCHVLSGMG
jgi:hypothetical protein